MSHTAEHLRLLEAIVFASAKPVTEAELARFLPEDADVAAVEVDDEHRRLIFSSAGGCASSFCNC